jgi:hypothetical protein
MRWVGGLLLVVLVACAGLLGAAASAGAAEPPEYDGDLVFPRISGPSDPGEYSWRVKLYEGEELRQIDDQGVAVFYESGHSAFSIETAPAHDATGAAVPTTLAVTGSELITLIVHHQAGNTAAGGAPFQYPVSYGSSFEIGPGTVVVQGPPDEAELRASRERAAAAEITPAPSTAPPKPERVLVTRALGEDKLYYRPHFFLLSGDGTFGVFKVQWKSYGGPAAEATARAFANDCIPYCAAGHFYKPQAKLRLSKIVQCKGQPVYARLRYQLVGNLPKSFPRRGGFSMLPLGENGKPDC